MSGLSLQNFIDISSGRYNAGQVDITTDKNGNEVLKKVNNHTFLTSKNNVVLDPEKVIKVKTAFINALKESHVSNEQLSKIRERIGLPESISIHDYSGLESETLSFAEKRFTPLTRKEINAILKEVVLSGKGAANADGSANITRKQINSINNSYNISGSKAETRDVLNSQAKIQSDIRQKATDSTFNNIVKMLSFDTGSLDGIFKSRCENHTGENAVNENAAEKTAITNTFKSMFSSVLRMLSPSVSESGTFMICGKPAVITKDDSGKLLVTVGKGVMATTISLNATAENVLQSMMIRATKDSAFLGKENMQSLLDSVFSHDLDGNLAVDDRNSLTRQFCLVITELTSRTQKFDVQNNNPKVEVQNNNAKADVQNNNPKADVQNKITFEGIFKGNYNTSLLVEIAERALNGEVIKPDDLVRYHEELMKDNSNLTEEMQQLLKEVANIPLSRSSPNVELSVSLTQPVEKIAENIAPGLPGAANLRGELKTADIKNFLADLIFSDDAIAADSGSQKAGDVLRSVLGDPKNVSAFAEIIRNPEVLNGTSTPAVVDVLKKGFQNMRTALDPYFQKTTGKSIDGAAGDGAKFLEDFTEFLKNEKALPGSVLFSFNTIIQDMAIARSLPGAANLGGELKTADIKNFVADMIFSDDTIAADSGSQKAGDVLRSVLGDPKNVSAFAEIIRNPEALNGTSTPAVVDVLKNGFQNMRTALGPYFQETTGKSIDEAAGDRAKFLEDFTKFLKNEKALPGSVLFSFNAIIQNMANNGCKILQNVINEVFNFDTKPVNELGGLTVNPYDKMNPTEIKAELGKKSLNNIIDNASSDTSVPGQMGLFKQVLCDYFVTMNKADKKTMFASALRFADTFNFADADGKPLEGAALESAKQSATVKFTGAILKGTGPLMQKMLQGMPRDVVGPFADALDDMKSNLAPIPRKIVQAHLMKMINDSNQKIKQIDIKQSLGAASVGEAFLCDFKYVGDEGKEQSGSYVVKIMRHDVEARVKREAEVFKNAAQKIGPGMEKTWEGLYEQYKKEFDFTLEAQNISEGEKIYEVADNGSDHKYWTVAPEVSSMHLANKLVEPSKNALVGTQAVGSTADRYFKETIKEIQGYTASMFAIDPATGRIKWDPQTKQPVLSSDVTDAGPKSVRNGVELVLPKIINAQKKLIQASRVWFTEALLGSGQFHGDCHAGNIMIAEYKTTFIDFGNFYKLETRPALDQTGAQILDTENKPVMVDEKNELLKLIMGTTVRNKEVFMKGFKNLLSPSGMASFETNRDKVDAIVTTILGKGDFSFDVCYRLKACLSELQKLGLELPPQINCFVQSMMRLQNSIAEMNTIINQCNKIYEVANNYRIPSDKVITDEFDLYGQVLSYSLTEEGRISVTEMDDDEEITVPQFHKKIREIYGGGSTSASTCKNFNKGGDYYEKLFARISKGSNPLEEAEKIQNLLLGHLDLKNSENDRGIRDTLVKSMDSFKEQIQKAGDDPKLKEQAIHSFTKSFCVSQGYAINFLMTDNLDTTKIKAPASFANVIMSTFFDDVDVAMDIINKKFKSDSSTLKNSVIKEGGKLGVGMLDIFTKGIDYLFEKIKDSTMKMGGDDSYQIDIGI